MRLKNPVLPPESAIWRAAPITAGALLLVVLALALPVHASAASTWSAVALSLGAALLSWFQLPPRARDFDLLVPVAYLVAIALLRDNSGTVSGFSPLVIVPVMWTAVHGDRTQLAIVLAGVAAVFVVPPLLARPGQDQVGDWRLAVLLPLVAAGVGITVQRLLYLSGEQTRSAERRAAMLKARYSVTRLLAREESLESAMPAVLTALGESMGWPVAFLWRVHHRRGVLRPGTYWQADGFAGEAIRTATVGCRLEPGQGLPGRVWADRRPGWRTDLGSDVSFGRGEAAASCGLRGAVAFPVRHGSEVVAVIECYAEQTELPADEVSELLDDLMLQLEQFVARVEHTEQLSQLEAMARTEELTGLPNRRAWEEAVPRELARARRTKRPLCVMLLDLDHFKTYNDRYGHQAGDRLLRDTARAWRATLRTSDFLARFGGDEFAALLPDCSIEQGVALVERLREASPATVSVGLAQWPGDESSEELIRRADTALYQAKSSGRDRLEVAAVV